MDNSFNNCETEWRKNDSMDFCIIFSEFKKK